VGVLGRYKFGGSEAVVPATFWLEKFVTNNSLMISVRLYDIGFEHRINLVGYRLPKSGHTFWIFHASKRKVGNVAAIFWPSKSSYRNRMDELLQRR